MQERVLGKTGRAAQVRDNVQAARLPPLTAAQMQAAERVYDQYLRRIIHPQWQRRASDSIRLFAA